MKEISITPLTRQGKAGAALLLLVLVMTTTTGAVAQEKLRCYTAPDPSLGYPWAWRMIDGRTCWYRGPRKYDKHLLHWDSGPAPKESAMTNSAASEPASPISTPHQTELQPSDPNHPMPSRAPPRHTEPHQIIDAMPLQSYSEEDQKLLESYWPDLATLLAERSPTYQEMFTQPPPESTRWRDHDIIALLVLALVVVSGLVLVLEVLRTKLDQRRTA